MDFFGVLTMLGGLALFILFFFSPIPLPVRLYKRTEICYHEGEMQSLSGGASYEC